MTDKPDNTQDEAAVALITGGARRVGRAVAQRLHHAGLRLVVHYYHSADEARSLQQELNQIRPDSVILVTADLSRTKQVRQLAKTAVNSFGRLDVLFNNASTFFPTPVDATMDHHWDQLMNVNLRAPFFLAQALAPTLAAHHGCIINMVDIYAQRPLLEHPVYCAAKAGLASLTRSLARELGPQVRVNGIAPGAIEWPENFCDELARRRMIASTPLKKTGSPQDIAELAWFLIHRAGFINGQIVAVDGGRSVVPG
ncbi:MAG TPA: pteridine reductase [Gammaproteobacteria bacterium]|nr:pteridine reductase [Gammaproteobacteria bacterium]